MNRKKVMEAVLEAYKKLSNANQVFTLEAILRRVPDMDLVVMANEMGIDTDALLGA